jgi:leucyl/phenylalanyl-tRNA---protein transferase
LVRKNNTMPARRSAPELAWLKPGDAFPSVQQAWGEDTDAPGLLAAGGSLDVATLHSAYSQGIFPWFNDEQPPLWWSTDPRMLLAVNEFRLSVSMRKLIRSLIKQQRLEIRMDNDFLAVIRACASSPRAGQSGTWIIEEMIEAYHHFHLAGHVHSVETWWDGELIGGLYAVNIGKMVYGESMFSRTSNASKIALCALVAFCRAHELPLIDCQQQTTHLASLGAKPVDRQLFLQNMTPLNRQHPPAWQFSAKDWEHLLAC